MKLIAFCEAPADFRLVSGLVDRVLRASGPEWVIANFESPDVIRTWQPDMFGRLYFDLHKLNDYTKELDVRGVRGHFDGRPGGAGSTMARKIFLIARALNKKLIDEPIEAVVLVWDTDWQSDERPRGVEVAREEARRWATFRIICGFPDPEREAWVLAGFDPGPGCCGRTGRRRRASSRSRRWCCLLVCAPGSQRSRGTGGRRPWPVERHRS